MTNYIYREREGVVKIIERVALPEGMTNEEAYAQHRDEWGGDNDFAYLAFSNISDSPSEIVSFDSSDIDDSEDYFVWYSDEDVSNLSNRVPQSRFRKFLEDNKLWFWKE